MGATEKGLWEALQNLSPPRLVLAPTGHPEDFDSFSLDFPFVIRYEGTWQMFYTGFDGKRFRLGLAKSLDLKGWEREGSPILSGWEAQSTLSAWVLRHNDLDEPFPKTRRGLFWMAFTETKGTEKVGTLNLAFSPDLRRWELFEGNPILRGEGKGEQKGVTTPCLLERDNLFWLFYTGYGERGAIGLALSPDFLVWSRDLENPILDMEGGCQRPFVFRYREQWWMLFTTSEGIQGAFSEDLRHWQMIETPLPMTIPKAQNPCLIWSGGKVHLFFAGGSENHSGIYYAEASLSGLTGNASLPQRRSRSP